ncbi:hypothetical protein RFI_33984, partial [Reticulomyxa filosa]
LRRKLQLEKHQYMVNSINSLQEGNTSNLFTPLNTNTICIIPALMNKDKSFDCNSLTYAVLLDISAAYDNGRLYWWIESFLSDRLGRVVLNGTNSDWMEFNTGVPQGSALSLILFLLYINDLPTVIHQPIQCEMFADDVALWTSIFSDSKMKFPKMQLTLQHSNLKECDHVKYLGLFLDSQMTYSKHVNTSMANQQGNLDI